LRRSAPQAKATSLLNYYCSPPTVEQRKQNREYKLRHFPGISITFDMSSIY
jgi:hypothetical protein